MERRRRQEEHGAFDPARQHGCGVDTEASERIGERKSIREQRSHRAASEPIAPSSDPIALHCRCRAPRSIVAASASSTRVDYRARSTMCCSDAALGRSKRSGRERRRGGAAQRRRRGAARSTVLVFVFRTCLRSSSLPDSRSSCAFNLPTTQQQQRSSGERCRRRFVVASRRAWSGVGIGVLSSVLVQRTHVVCWCEIGAMLLSKSAQRSATEASQTASLS